MVHWRNLGHTSKLKGAASLRLAALLFIAATPGFGASFIVYRMNFTSPGGPTPLTGGFAFNPTNDVNPFAQFTVALGQSSFDFTSAANSIRVAELFSPCSRGQGPDGLFRILMAGSGCEGVADSWSLGAEWSGAFGDMTRLLPTLTFSLCEGADCIKLTTPGSRFDPAAGGGGGGSFGVTPDDGAIPEPSSLYLVSIGMAAWLVHEVRRSRDRAKESDPNPPVVD